MIVTGYVLEKGKLTFNVAYLMENRKLEGKNSIYINQLTLGDTVDSPDAVSLPIQLAVALRAFLLENRLKARKLEKSMKAGKSAVPLEEITFAEGERETLVKTVFEESDIAVPKDDSGKPIELTPELREQLLRDNTDVSQNDYRNLANARAFNAKNYLLEAGQVERERVFIVEPRIDGDEDQAPTDAAGQVIISLK